MESNVTLPRLLAGLGTSTAGLSSTEAARRLRDRGPNEVATRTLRTKAFELARVIANPLVVILLVAGTASALLQEAADATTIFVIVLLSSALDAWQTLRSERTVRRLQQQIAPNATVLRDQAWVELPRPHLVAGDIIRLAAGDMVPADARLIEAIDLHVQQSALMPRDLVERNGVRRDHAGRKHARGLQSGDD